MSTLASLLDKYQLAEPKVFAGQSNVRAVEFGHKVDEYALFLSDVLLPFLGYGDIPVENRTIIGSSMSATASLYMAMPHHNSKGESVPPLFGKVIVQAPSYSNRSILDAIIEQRQQDKEKGLAAPLATTIRLSCGQYDSLENAQNLNWDHTLALSVAFGLDEPLPILSGPYGHLIHCWSHEVLTLAPSLYKEEEKLTASASP